MKTTQKIILLGLIVLLQACVNGAKYTKLTKEAQNSINQSKAYHLVIQDEIKPDVELMNASGALGGGLIAAAIDSATNDDRASDARDLMLPLYEEITDVDYRKLIAKYLNPVFVKTVKLESSDDSAQIITKSDKELKNDIKNLKSDEAYIFTSSFYQLREQSQILQTVTIAYVFTKQDKPNLSKPVYYNTFVYQSPHVGTGGSNSILEWSKDNAELFRNQLEKSAEKTAEWLAYDMQTSYTEQCIKGGKVTIQNALGAREVKGNVISQSDDISVLREKLGTLNIISSKSVKSAKVKECKAGV